MKRVLALTLMLVFLFATSVFAKPVEIEFWNLFTGGDGEYMDQIVEEFNKTHPDIKVNSTVLDWGQYYTKLTTAIATGNAPDVAVAHTSRLADLVQQGLLMELDNLAELTGVDWDTFNQTILDATIVDGIHYAVPIDTHPIVFYYNKKYLRNAGLLDENERPILENTPEGFIKFMNTLKASLPEGVFALSFPTAGSDPFRVWFSFYKQLGGGPILSKDMRNVTMDREAALQAAKYLYSWYYEHEFVPLHLQDFYEDFQAGRAASIITGVWATGIWETTEGLEFGVIPFPKVFGKQAQWADSHTLVLPYKRRADQEKVKAAITFANFVAEHGELWAKAGHVVSKVTVLEKDAFKSLPYRSDYAAAANYAVFEQSGAKTWAVRDAIIRNLDTILSRDATPEAAIENMVKEIKAIR